MSDELSSLQFVDELIGQCLKLVQLRCAVEGNKEQRDRKQTQKGNDGRHETSQVRLAIIVAEAHSHHGYRSQPENIQEIIIVLESAIASRDSGFSIIECALENPD